MFVVWPGAGSVAIMCFIGLAAVLIGALLISLARRVQQAAKRIDNLGPGGA